MENTPLEITNFQVFQAELRIQLSEWKAGNLQSKHEKYP
jgi:hypothetical protein